MIQYRTTNDPADMPRIVDLEILIWGTQERDTFPASMLSLAAMNGGQVFIAEAEDSLVGFCFCLPARRNGELVLWSYIAGVHPNYQGQGIGEKLKLMQREWAAESGYSSVRWTFDPLQTRNAGFNLNRLGVVVRTYHENLYGQMTDAINTLPLPSDRLEAIWLTQPTDHTGQVSTSAVHFLLLEDNGLPVENLMSSDGEPVAIVIPERGKVDFTVWQPAVRRAFQHAFAHNYEAFRFERQPTQQFYVLRPSAAP